MHLARVAGLLLASISTPAQQQSVEITSEPSHHLVLENAYVRVFDVTVAPKAATLVYRHHNDYLFVTLGDSDVVSARPGEKPAALQLKDGEIHFTPGKFEHAAINQSDKPFHNITIELLKPATNVKTCNGDCAQEGCLGATPRSFSVEYPALNSPVGCPSLEQQITSDQWKMSLFSVQASVQVEIPSSKALLVAVSDLLIQHQLDGAAPPKLAPGGIIWLPTDDVQSIKSATAEPARYVLLEFPAEKQ
jgi:hypothetical protein